MLPRIYDGTGQPAPDRLTLRAGLLTMQYEAGMLRYVQIGRTEIIRGIYAAVRDHNWGTVPAELRNFRLEQSADAFRITFDSDHRQGDIHFLWHGTITGTADSTLTFTFDGEALTEFRRNRIGFCVLHPMDLAGTPLTIEHTDGSFTTGAFPREIAPHQPFFNIRSITHDVLPGLRAETRMEGDAFEMEDQRNWTDASYKTYCTPLGMPFPVLIERGTVIRQSITLRLIGAAPTLDVREPAHEVHVTNTRTASLPLIGLGVASHGEPLTARELARLKALNLSHLRVDLRPDDTAEAALAQAWAEAQALGAQLEVALHVGAASLEDDLTRFRDLLERQNVRGSAIVFRDGELAASAETIAKALAALAPLPLAIGTGTDGYFTQLNRIRPDLSRVPAPLAGRLGFVAYSVNPQVHAFDNASLVETIPVIGETVRSARRFSPVEQIAVTPVTFKIRWNPDATAPDPPTPAGQLPRRVDVRQMSLFGAGWTVGALASLAGANCHSATFFETTGWLGVMERESGAPVPDKFPSVPGGVFPMYHVFADVGAFAGADVLECRVSHPLTFSALTLRRADRVRMLLANHTQRAVSVTVFGTSGPVALKVLDETAADAAQREPESYRAVAGEAASPEGDGLPLDLPPCAVVRLDWSTRS